MEASALYWTKVAAIGQIAGALATFAAVFVALYLARSERRTRLRVTAQHAQIVDALGATKTVSITVQNIGLRAAKIDGVGWIGGLPSWSIPRLVRWAIPRWLRQQTLHQIHDYSWAINENFPWRLQPGESKSTHFRRDKFFDEFTSKQGEAFFRKVPFLKRTMAVRPRVFVSVDTKPVITGIIAKSLLSQMREAYEIGKE